MSTLFPVVGRTSTGYDREQVEEFFTRARQAYEAGRSGTDAGLTESEVRQVAFDLVRAGYATGSVDSALDRLEAALVQRRRDAFVAAHGQQAWMDRIAERATTLYPRLVRPAGERFAAPERGRGYDRDAVDDLMDRLVAYFDADGDLTAAELRTATFPSARRDKAYAEGVVDAYLDRAVEVLLAVE
ncbi:DivIVA domain-containing protein [Georgenia satyanarayanai]|uniref:DivIVA domain-containing protein n=1 Tax=Georgenia satyanarayanai TaxID=860221 RepID=A0A2Y9AC88_9MICO|nr:DivIVA domain-containing protein [Georgenia satyanarayanai]PYF99900.1 DivIVA domain-containing protein [Georgenia satyanarayanai]SSA41900.1 DivIVA domain-containing protein [Georgenia satyanarayanai]